MQASLCGTTHDMRLTVHAAEHLPRLHFAILPSVCVKNNMAHSECVQNNERLLKLYESGLPVWAVFLPTYGLYYRPWMRRLTWILFIAVSIFSMACGFYDLYKNVPHVDKVRPWISRSAAA